MMMVVVMTQVKMLMDMVLLPDSLGRFHESCVKIVMPEDKKSQRTNSFVPVVIF